MPDKNDIPISKIFEFDDDGGVVFLESSSLEGIVKLPSKLPLNVKRKIKQHYPDIQFIEEDIEFGPLVEKSGEPGMVFISKLVAKLASLAERFGATGELPRGQYCEICGETKNFEYKKKSRMYLCNNCAKDTPAKASQDEFVNKIRAIQKKVGHEMDKSEEMTLRNSFYPDYKASKYSSVAEYWESCSS